MNPVSVVTIKNKIALFKKEEPATNIELIELEEVGFTLVAQKDLYSIGDKAVYIQPDYCLSDISIFEPFLRPFGDASKSKLGSKNRVRAIKFNFHTGDYNPVFSVGILLPISEVENYVEENSNKQLTTEELPNFLGITKWEEPDEKGKSNFGGISGASQQFPVDVYKTDEENINNLWNHIEKNIKYPVQLIGSVKYDGSSLTIGCKNGEGFICSRNMKKPVYITKIVGRREKNIWDYLQFWKKPDLNIYEKVLNDSDFVKYGKPYMDKLVEYCKKEKQDYIVRFEIHGGNLKGSGNKNNPSSKHGVKLHAFGVDIYKDVSIKLPELEFNRIITELGFERCPVLFNKVFNSRQEIEQECNNYFKNNMIEGIVLRTLDSNFSTKFMNLEYDSKK